MPARPEAAAGVADIDLSDRTVLVTGSTDGVGRETALALGRLGADVLVHGRDPGKGAAVVEALSGTDATATFHRADFASPEAVRDLAAAARERGVDVLVNNAGAYLHAGGLTDAGVERTFAVNHLAPFLLTTLLAGALPADGRVVTVASEAHRGVELDLDAVRTVEGYDGLRAYRRSKLANVLFTRELARRIDQPANCLHPGFVPGSALWRDASLPVSAGVGVLRRLPDAVVNLVGATPSAGAATPVYLVAAPAAGETTGRYFVDCEPTTPSGAARDDDAAARLWSWSVDAAGLAAAEADAVAGRPDRGD